jgi:ABC-type transport system involved in multi-copper enzyme maturation permease subunit
MFEQVWTIARNTFTESIRQPIFVVLLGGCVTLLAINPTLAAYTLGDDNKLLTDMGLSMIFLAGLLLAAFTATGVLNREIENKTVLTVIAKPISRPAFVLGKYLGVTAAVGLAFYIWSLVFLLSVRHKVMSTAADKVDGPVLLLGALALVVALIVALWGNYFYNWVFTSRFTGLLASTLTAAYLGVLIINKEWAVQSIMEEFTHDEGQLAQIVLALAMVMQGLAVLCAIAIACSTRLGQVMTLLICLGVYMLGLGSDYLFGRWTDSQPLAWIGYAAAPNIGFVWLADALTQKSPVSGLYIASVTGYIALYIVAALSLAVALFQTRETG